MAMNLPQNVLDRLARQTQRSTTTKPPRPEEPKAARPKTVAAMVKIHENNGGGEGFEFCVSCLTTQGDDDE